jgi:hypothetical protein
LGRIVEQLMMMWPRREPNPAVNRVQRRLS